ncbi:methyl transferase-like protein [Mycena vitilis]|nr:methyl transferase-like protein [Mycena vitilis]
MDIEGLSAPCAVPHPTRNALVRTISSTFTTPLANDPNLQNTIEGIALYNQRRVTHALAALVNKPLWSLDDTAAFDCMHYEGNDALDRCALALQAEAGASVLDVGAGYGSTGRYLHTAHGLNVIGLELQQDINAVASLINRRTAMPAGAVRSVHGDLLADDIVATVGGQVDHAVSFLCILHIPDRARVFSQLAALVRPNGRVYIEDYAARRPLSADEERELREIVACPSLPTRETYLEQATSHGFTVLHDNDLTARWTKFVGERADAYALAVQRDETMQRFYYTVRALFETGALAGMGLTLQRMG